MIIPFIPFLVFFEIGIVHVLLFYLTNRIWKNLKFGPSLYFTGLISGLISFVVDWYGILPFLVTRTTEGFMMGIGLFMYMSWVIVPVCYLLFLIIFYIIKRRHRKYYPMSESKKIIHILKSIGNSVHEIQKRSVGGKKCPNKEE